MGGCGAPTDGVGDPLAKGQPRPVLEDQEVVESVLPGLDAVPGGWRQENDASVLEASTEQCGSEQPDLLFCGEAAYQDPATNNVARFRVYPLQVQGWKPRSSGLQVTEAGIAALHGAADPRRRKPRRQQTWQGLQDRGVHGQRRQCCGRRHL
ncbi:hypothetical protein GCM10010279_47290 [Streptomyces mutabilis]|nr:hypothetical protein GCM10010279_47290 [Streptomyces mutabilis]